MQRFKEFFQDVILERKSVATALVNEIVELEHNDGPDKFMKDVSDYLFERGGLHLGEGIFSEVYGGREGGYVVKTSRNDFKYRELYSITKTNTSPLFPKIVEHRSLKVDDEQFDIYVIERLIVDRSSNVEWDREFNSIAMTNYNLKEIIQNMMNNSIFYERSDRKESKDLIDKILKKKNSSYKELNDFAKIIREFSDSNDVHTGNFGFREDDTLVIFDPVS